MVFFVEHRVKWTFIQLFRSTALQETIELFIDRQVKTLSIVSLKIHFINMAYLTVNQHKAIFASYASFIICTLSIINYANKLELPFKLCIVIVHCS